MTLSSAELAAHSNAIRLRLLELHENLKVDFSGLCLVSPSATWSRASPNISATSAENGRKQVWGLDLPDQRQDLANLVSESPGRIRSFCSSALSEEQLDRLQDEPAPNTRVSLFGFATQMMQLKRPLYDFLNQIFEPTRYHVRRHAARLLLHLGHAAGNPDRPAHRIAVQELWRRGSPAGAQYSGLGKSFFLHDLILKVVIGESRLGVDRLESRAARP